MELRDPIHGTVEIDDFTKAVVDSQVFQRLRSIKQLGFSEFSFPGATHNRLIHSVGVSHIAGKIFNRIFENYDFPNSEAYRRLKRCTQLAALLHDIGHGPLSHTTEEVMPHLSELNVKAYDKRRTDIKLSKQATNVDRKANHEDYTIKLVTDSDLTNILDAEGTMSARHVACLIDKTLASPDDFFVVDGINFRNILSQIVSSELDADRMDYLERDAYFCGTNYGRVEISWLIANMTYHRIENELYLAINRRALYAFDDFLLARHHMHLMVYFHHKSIVYEEMLYRYLSSKECTFSLPGTVEGYIKCNDYSLYQHLDSVDNEWAQRISKRKAYKMLFELHSTSEEDRVAGMQKELEKMGVQTILANSKVRLSKYHSTIPEERSFPIYVVDQYDRQSQPFPIEQTTEIFQKYEEIRRIERLYVNPEQYKDAEKIIIEQKL